LESGDAPSALVTLDEALSLADALPDELRAVVREHRDAAARAAGDSP
ncbi:MAG: hypothetical protein F6K42_17150, partial [Leptolyngbya sp. SIO1D8]|nr:hypothetical protein [Leptolyngbya sp. SIO1D8]